MNERNWKLNYLKKKIKIYNHLNKNIMDISKTLNNILGKRKMLVKKLALL